MSPSSLPRHTSVACHAVHSKRSIVGNGMSLGACVCAVVPLNQGLSKTDPKLTWHRHTWPWQNYIRIRNKKYRRVICRHILTRIPSWGPAVGQWVVKLLDSMCRLPWNFTYQQPTKPTRYSSPDPVSAAFSFDPLCLAMSLSKTEKLFTNCSHAKSAVTNLSFLATGLSASSSWNDA